MPGLTASAGYVESESSVAATEMTSGAFEGALTAYLRGASSIRIGTAPPEKRGTG